LGVFHECSISHPGDFGEFFGFTEEDASQLYSRRLAVRRKPLATLDELREWCGGVAAGSGAKLYNPRSFSMALSSGICPKQAYSDYMDIYKCVDEESDDVIHAVALLAAGGRLASGDDEAAPKHVEHPAKRKALFEMMERGFISRGDGFVSIPNRELMIRFEAMLWNEASFGTAHALVKASGELLEAALRKHGKAVAKILNNVSASAPQMFSYASKADLAAIVALAFVKARRDYKIAQFSNAGEKEAIFLFSPRLCKLNAFVLMLKIGDSARDALESLLEKNCIDALAALAGTSNKLSGWIASIAIVYSTSEDRYRCLTCFNLIRA
jgi:hypothetical protein